VIERRTQAILARENPVFDSLISLSKGKADAEGQGA
jgi:hypothetical protein